VTPLHSRAILPVLLLLAGALTAAAGGADSCWTVMSFNLRYAGGDAGDHAWEARREAVAGRVRAAGADIVATQECLAVQAEDLRRLLPGYRLAGVGRDDGDEAGEMCAILWRRDRFIKLEEGHRWHAEPGLLPSPPDADAACVRLFSWVLLAERAEPRRRLLVVDTHLDHVGAEARRRAAHRLRDWLAGRDPAVPVVLTGDFNAPAEPGSPPYDLLTAEDPPLPLVDSFRALHPAGALPEGTFHGFRDVDEPARIDWILASPSLHPRAAWIDRERQDGVVPSDHHPVVAVLEPVDGSSP
jgi:endonuclease/exonuclease/phosphatase family metal-dependent hydrolase